MRIEVPADIRSALNLEDVLTEVRHAVGQLESLRAKATGLLDNNPLAQMLADGLARQNEVETLEGAVMTIDELGHLVVVTGDKVEMKPKPKAKSKGLSYPELKELADSLNVDISDLDGRKKKQILARIEAAQKAAAEPTEPEAVVEPEPEATPAQDELDALLGDEGTEGDDGLNLDALLDD